MQFTEISELRSIVGIKRSQAQSSSIFHDRHDSEVDRLYNSSPEASIENLEDLVEDAAGANASNAVGTKAKATQDSNKDEKSGAGNRATGKGGCKVVYFDSKKNKVTLQL